MNKAPGPSSSSSDKASKAPPRPALIDNPLSLGNACAALAELHHFGRPDTAFSAHFQDKEPPLTDAEPPFARTVLLAIPEPAQARSAQEVIGMAASFLLGDGCFGLDRLAAAGRAGLPVPPPARRGQYFETFGSYRLAFPRRRIVGRLASVSLQKIVQRWMSKDTRSLEEAVSAWVDEQWRGQELAAEHFIGRVQQACEKRLGKAPEAAFNAALAPLLKALGETGKPSPPPGEQPGPRRGSAPRPKRVLTPEDVAEVLTHYQELLGQPEGMEEAAPPGGEPPPPAPLPQTLREAAAAIAAEWSQKLAELPVRLIEKPAFRLPGAEEAVRRVVATIEKVLTIHEPLARELADRAGAAYAKLMTLLAQSNDPRSWPRRGTATPQEILNLLRDYPKCRYQALVLQQVLGVYVSLRGHLTDTLREINFCRLRLGELSRTFGASSNEERGTREKDGPFLARPSSLVPQPTPEPRAPAKEEYGADVEGPGKYLFRAGCKNLGEAVTQFEAILERDTLLDLDSLIQKAIRSKFGSLVQVCLAPANVTGNVATTMREVAEAFIDERLEKVDVAQLFLAQHQAAASQGSGVRGQGSADKEQSGTSPLLTPDHWALSPDYRDTAADELITLYEEAVPEPSRTVTARTVSAQSEVTVLLAPASSAGNAVRELAESTLADTSLITAAAGDDLLIYREWSNLALTDLENLGPVGQEAYRQLLATDNFTPHSRLDIEFELPS